MARSYNGMHLPGNHPAPVIVSSCVADPGCLSRIRIFLSRIRIRIKKNLSIFNPKNYLISRYGTLRYILVSAHLTLLNLMNTGTFFFSAYPLLYVYLPVNTVPVYGNCSSQLPHLIEKLPQWLSGPSPVLPAAGSPPDTKPGQTVFYAQKFLFNYWHRLTKNA
jgi:hypothetical protein